MFICGVPKDADAFSRVYSLEQDLFGGLSVPATVARKIYDCRPEAFCSIIDDRDASVAAYSIAYPLQPWSAAALIEGEISEPDLTTDMLLGYQDAHEDAYVYVSSVFVGQQYDGLTKATLLASLLSWRSRQLRDATIKRLSVIMVGVSDQGDRLIRYVGAKKLRDGFERKDGYPIYGRKITRGFLLRAANSIERCINSRIVVMDYSFKPATQAGFDTTLSTPILVPERTLTTFATEKVIKVRQPDVVSISPNSADWRKNAAAGEHRPRGHLLQRLFKTAQDVSHKIASRIKAETSGLLSQFRDEPIKILLQSLVPVLLGTLALLAIESPIATDHPTLIFLPITGLTAFCFGGTSALITTVTAALASAYFFYAPAFSFCIDDPMDICELAVFIVASLSFIKLSSSQIER